MRASDPKQYIYVISPGHRPMACQILHQLLLCSSVIFFFTSPRARGGRWDLRPTPIKHLESFWRPLGALGRHRADSNRFFDDRNTITNLLFFDSQIESNLRKSRPVGARASISWMFMTCGPPRFIHFSIYPPDRSEK